MVRQSRLLQQTTTRRLQSGGKSEGWRDERRTGSIWTCLVFGVGRKELAVEMCGQDNAPCCVWVFRRDHIGEVFQAIWCHVLESVLFYVPIELSERRNDVISNKSV